LPGRRCKFHRPAWQTLSEFTLTDPFSPASAARNSANSNRSGVFPQPVSAGTGTSGAGASSNQGNSFNSGRSRGGGISYQQTERRVLLPQEIMNIRAGHGLMWLPGMGTSTIPFFAPNYWNRHAPWVKAVKSNPYQRG
jgi:hypothetical protein